MKRRLLTIAIFLLLGSVVNVAVAWGCGEWSWRYLGMANFESSSLPSDADWALAAPPNWPRPNHKVTISGFELTFGSLNSITMRASYVQQIGQWGWPFRCLQSETHGSATQAPSTATVGSFLSPTVITRTLKPIDPANGFLLIRPIWPGFAINTLFYATLFWLLISGPFVLRRFLWVRRGLCPKCAYPMGESSVCTECGCELRATP